MTLCLSPCRRRLGVDYFRFKVSQRSAGHRWLIGEIERCFHRRGTTSRHVLIRLWLVSPPLGSENIIWVRRRRPSPPAGVEQSCRFSHHPLASAQVREQGSARPGGSSRPRITEARDGGMTDSCPEVCSSTSNPQVILAINHGRVRRMQSSVNSRRRTHARTHARGEICWICWICQI